MAWVLFLEKRRMKREREVWLTSECLVCAKVWGSAILPLERLLLSPCKNTASFSLKGLWWCFLLSQLRTKMAWSSNIPWWTLIDFQSRPLKSYFWKAQFLLAGYFPHFWLVCTSPVLQHREQNVFTCKSYLRGNEQWTKAELDAGRAVCLYLWVPQPKSTAAASKDRRRY